MQKWEYRILQSAYAGLESVANSLGELGWELVSYSPLHEGPGGL
jgi:hypothetical protein